MRRVFCKVLCSVIITSIFVSILALVVPMISFGKSLDAVAADAARMYGIEAYTIEFKDKLTNSNGSRVNGLYLGFVMVEGQPVHQIRVQNSIFRPTVVATIFHEFAHAAQTQFNLDLGEYNKEQHAEILSFGVMWANGYWWDALHLLTLHTVGGKPADYRAAGELWNIATTATAQTTVTAFMANSITA